MKNRIFLSTFLLVLGLSLQAFFIGCGSKNSPKAVISEQPKPPAIILPEKTVEEVYRYGGDIYRDPFSPLTEKRIVSPMLQAQGEAEKPNIGIFDLKGILTDQNCKMALFSSPMGIYILKNGKLYDNRNRVVRGVNGSV